MSTLIVYAGTQGSTAKMAARIAESMEGKAEIVNLHSQKAPSLDRYEKVVLGGSIMAGSVPKPLKNFIAAHSDTLLQKKVGLFLCCLIEDQVDEYFRTNFPEPLYSHAITHSWLGGELVMSQHNFLVRKMLHKIIGSRDDIHNMHWQAADQLAVAMLAA